MALVSPRQRIKAPEVPVSGLEKMVDTFLMNRGSRDLMKQLSSLKTIAWSHAPKSGTIVEFADLFFLAVDLAANLKINHKDLTKACVALHKAESGAILFGSSAIGVELLAAQASFRMRCALSKFRDLASDVKMYERMVREVISVDL